MPGIELEINGDSRSAQQALSGLSSQLDSTSAELNDFAKQVNASAKITNTQLPAAANKAAKAIKAVKSPTDQSTQALVNLSRVAQDAPYGFIGIANNLNPLLESFQRLNATTGSSGASLKALGASLIGPAGIGLALGVVSSLLVTFGDKLFGASKEVKALDKSVKDSAQSFADESTKLTTLVGLINNTATANKDRDQALKALNQEYEKYLKNLGIEEVKLANVNDAYIKIIDSMLKQAVVKGIQDEIAASVQKTAESIIKLQVEQEKQRLAQSRVISKEQEAANKAKQDSAARINLMNQYRGVASDGAIAQAAMTAEISATNAEASTFDNRIKSLKGELMKTLEPLLNLTTNFADLGIKLDKTGNKAEAASRKIIAEAKKIAAYYNSRTNRVFQFDEDPELSLAKNVTRAQEFIQRALDAGQRRTFELKINARIKFEQIDLDNKRFKAFEKLAEQSRKAFEKAINDAVDKNPVRFRISNARADGDKLRQQGLQMLGLTDPEDDLFAKFGAQATKSAIILANTVNGILTPAFQSLFQAIQQGESPLKAFFQSIGNAINQLISKLIAAAVQAAILSAIFPGGFGGVKGFSGFFKNILGFAAGGLVSGPTLSLIGEGVGTSRSNPEVVAPLDQLKSMLGNMGGGGNVNVTVTGRIRSNDIALSNARNQRRNNRLGA